MNEDDPSIRDPSDQWPSHDAFFRISFSDPETAAALFRQFLPADLVAKSEWHTLRPEAESYIDSDLRARYSDILFSCRLAGQPVFYYLLLEHKSSPEYWTNFHLLELMIRIWRKRLDGSNSAVQKLPPIIPIVVFQGPSPWPYSLQFNDYLLPVESSSSGLGTLYCQHLLVDLSTVEWENFRGQARYQVAMRILKAVRAGNPWDELSRLVPLLHQLGPKGSAMLFLQALSKYIMSARQAIDLSTFDAILAKFPEEEPKHMFMSLREQIEAVGLERGRQEGRQEGLLQGERKGQMTVLREILGLPALSSDSLADLTPAQIDSEIQKLKSDLSTRLKN